MSFFKSLKGYLTYLQISKSTKNETSVHIYSEGLNYRNYFIEIIRSLNNRNIKVLYFTSDKKDLELIDESTKPIFIGSGLVRILFFTKLKCRLMLMTLTDLGNHELKRSKDCRAYAYIFHSLVSTHKSYNKNSFKNYDIIFTNGEYQHKELIKSEEVNKLKRKKIYNTGYSYLEFLKKQKIKDVKVSRNILFAPSWSKFKDDLLEKHGFDIINEISKQTKITLRPHPQSLIKSKKIITKIEENFSNNDNFSINKNIFDINSIFDSKLLITDNGGMALEYAYILRKPVIFIDYKDKIHNEEFRTIGLEPIEDSFKKKFGLVVRSDQIKNLNKIIDKKIENYKNFNQEIDDFFNEHKIDFKNSSNKIAEIINEELNN